MDFARKTITEGGRFGANGILIIFCSVTSLFWESNVRAKICRTRKKNWIGFSFLQVASFNDFSLHNAKICPLILLWTEKVIRQDMQGKLFWSI